MATHANAQPAYNATDQTPDVPFVPLLAGFIAWPILKLLIEYMLGLMNPRLLEDLKGNPRRGYDLYFGVWLGTIFKIVSISACNIALFKTSAETDIVGLVRPLNTAEQVCWGCRAIIYIQELPHISSIPELVIHHILSVGAMIAIWKFNIPRRQLYIAWAGLFSEFVSNARRLFRFHARLGPRLDWWLSTANVILILAFRFTGCLVALVWTLQSGIRGVSLIIDVSSWLIYLYYMLDVSKGEAIRNKLITFDSKPRATITIAETFQIGPLGIILGLGFVATELSAILLYEFTGNHIGSIAELHTIAWVALQAAIAGVIGSYATPQFIDFMFSAFKKAVSSTEDAPHYQRRSMQGALLFAALALKFSPTIADKAVHVPFLVACMTISWPLLVTLSHVAQYMDSARPFHLVAGLLSGISYLSLLVAVLNDIIPNVYQAAVLAICLEITIRRVTDHRHPDATDPTARPSLSLIIPTRLSETDILPWFQLVWCLSLLSHKSYPVDGFVISFQSINPLRSDPKKLVGWCFLVTLCHLTFELMASRLLEPALPASPELDTKLDDTPSRGGKKRGNKKPRAVQLQRTTTRPKGILNWVNLKFLASFSGVALVLLIFWASYYDIMPKAITEIQSGSTGERELGGETFQFVLEVVSSWQVLVSVAAVAGLPVVLKGLD